MNEDLRHQAQIFIHSKHQNCTKSSYYNWANGLHSSSQVQLLSSELQNLSKNTQESIPLFIAVDQEGGVVARLNKGFTEFPGNKALGETQNPDLAEFAAFVMGQELKAVGVNFNLAPVVDVNINPRNPVIGIRSFGNNPEEVSVFGEKALKGYRRAGIIATLKHFPGHGDVEIDSHEDLPIIHKSIEELSQVELLPFARLATAAEVIMTAHLLVPSLDRENCSTLSEVTLNLLKKNMGFQGIIISDSLVMDGVLKKCHTIDEAAIQALNAGCDILLLGGKLLTGGHVLELTVSDIQRIHSAIVEAVKYGRVKEERLNEATTKILALKKRYLTSKITESKADLSLLVDTPKHKAIAKKIADLALNVSKHNIQFILSLAQKKIYIFSPQILEGAINKSSFNKIGKETHITYYQGLDPTEKEIAAAMQIAVNADIILVCSYNAWKNPNQAALIQSLQNTSKPLILLVTRDPLDASLFKNATLVFHTYSPSSISLETVFEYLTK
jgi:beta-N-acetylhexosaminidase